MLLYAGLGYTQTTIYYTADVIPLSNDYFSITSNNPQTACDLAKPSFDAQFVPVGGTSSITVQAYTNDVYSCNLAFRPPNDTNPHPSLVTKSLNRIWCQQGQVLTKITEEIPPWGTVITGQCKDKPKPTLIGFFNGVANDKKDAQKNLDRLEEKFPTSAARPMIYEVLHNHTACTDTNKVACLADVAETFAQRSAELDGVLANRWEIFWEMLQGNHARADALTKTLQTKLTDTSNNFGNFLLSLFDTMRNKMAAISLKFVTLFTGPSTQVDVDAQLSILEPYAKQDAGMVLVAHSQGNLFANTAFTKIKEIYPNAKIEAVHVAPASPTLSGGYTLVDIDVVIQSVRVLGGSVPLVNLSIPASDDDKLGHSFLTTYMDEARAAYTKIRHMIKASLDKVAPAAGN